MSGPLVKKLFRLIDIKVFIATVLIYLLEFLIVNYEQDVLATQLGKLHGLLEEVALPLALGVVSVDVVLDQLILALFGCCGFVNFACHYRLKR